MKQSDRLVLISAYGTVIGQAQSTVGDEASLPAPKGLLRDAIREELALTHDSEVRRNLRNAYVLLETFLPSAEYRIVATDAAVTRAAAGLHNIDTAQATELLDQLQSAKDPLPILRDVQERIRARIAELDELFGRK